MVLYQDSASTHTSIQTLQYLDDADLNYVYVLNYEEWRPKSPDAATMNYSFCGIPTKELKKNSIRTVAERKPILKMVCDDPTQDAIDRALNSWSRHVDLYIINMNSTSTI